VVPLRSIQALLDERRYSSYPSLTSSLEGGALPPGKEPSVPIVYEAGGGGSSRAGLDAEVRGKILCLCRGPNPGRPVRSQTLYWLSYPGSCYLCVTIFKSKYTELISPVTGTADRRHHHLLITKRVLKRNPFQPDSTSLSRAFPLPNSVTYLYYRFQRSILTFVRYLHMEVLGL
jgi:hypothetical protein